MELGAGIVFKLLNLILKPIIYLIKRIRLFIFKKSQQKTRSDPVQIKKAFMIGQGLTNEPLTAAYFFNNVNDKKVFLLTVSKDSVESWSNYNVRLYQEAGEGYSLVWNAGDIYISDVNSVQTTSLLKDGFTQVFIFSSSHGTAFGVDSVSIFCTKRKKEYSVIESYHHSSMSFLSTEISPIEIDIELRERAILYIQENGMLQKSIEVDVSSPLFAVNKWLIDNGEKNQGIVHTVKYPGFPVYGQASVNFERTYGNITWISFFKGPLFVYDSISDTHEVVFAYPSGYSWVPSGVGGKEHFWFVTHIPAVLMLFNKVEKRLFKYCEINNENIQSFEYVSEDDCDIIYLVTENGKYCLIPEMLKMCQDECKRNDSHFQSECGYPPL